MHALLARMRESEVRAVAVEVSAQALSRHRVDGIVFDVVGVHEPEPRPPRRLRRHGGVLPGEAPAVPAGARPSRRRLARHRLGPPRRPGLPHPGHHDHGAPRRRGRVARRHRRGTRGLHRVPTDRTRGPRAHHPRAADRLAHGCQRRAGDRHARRGRFRARCDRARARERPPALRGRAATATVSAIECYLPGRTERVSGDRGPSVYVDFGHSPDAFLNTLAAVRQFTPGKVVMLFGADGDRDTTKRADMARVAAEGWTSSSSPTTTRASRTPPRSGRPWSTPPAPRFPEHEIHEVSPPEAAIRTAVETRRRGRLDPLGRPGTPGLPRHPGRPHAVLGPRRGPRGTPRGRLGAERRPGGGRRDDRPVPRRDRRRGRRRAAPRCRRRLTVVDGSGRDRLPPGPARQRLLRAARRGDRRPPLRGRRGRGRCRTGRHRAPDRPARRLHHRTGRRHGRVRRPRRARARGRRPRPRLERRPRRRRRLARHRCGSSASPARTARRAPRTCSARSCPDTARPSRPRARSTTTSARRSRCSASPTTPGTWWSRWARAAWATSPSSSAIAEPDTRRRPQGGPGARRRVRRHRGDAAREVRDGHRPAGLRDRPAERRRRPGRVRCAT